MTPKAKSIAAAAGFVAWDDRAMTATPSQPKEALGMRLIASPMMPEGYVGLVIDTGIIVFPPSGKLYFIPHIQRQLN